MDNVIVRLREAYPRIAAQLLSPLVETLVAARAASGGDAEAFLILMSVGLRMVEQDAFRDLSYGRIDEGLEPIGPGTNVSSIAESTGIPRETVRRKVEALEAAGLLVRRDQLLFCTPAAFAAFAPVREAVLRFAARSWRVVGGVLLEG